MELLWEDSMQFHAMQNLPVLEGRMISMRIWPATLSFSSGTIVLFVAMSCLVILQLPILANGLQCYFIS